MDINKLFESMIGNNYDELVKKGQQNYPDVPVGSRHHAQASQQIASKYGFIPSQVLGLGVEGAEALLNPRGFNAKDTLNDLRANFQGGAKGTYDASGIDGILEALRK